MGDNFIKTLLPRQKSWYQEWQPPSTWRGREDFDVGRRWQWQQAFVVLAEILLK